MTDQTQPHMEPEAAKRPKWPWVLLWTLVLLALTVYLVVYVFLVGGIVQVVDGFNAHPHNGSDIAWGILRVACAAAGVIPAFLGFGALAAWAMGKPKPKRRLRKRV